MYEPDWKAFYTLAEAERDAANRILDKLAEQERAVSIERDALREKLRVATRVSWVVDRADDSESGMSNSPRPS